MAAKSFIEKKDLPRFKEHFNQCFKQMNESGESWHWLSRKISLNLELYLIDRLSKISNREKIQVISVGSWSRSELCPRSDIDVILLGEESQLKQFVSEAESIGVYLKYRTPADIKDWSVGVHAFDHLSLLFAVPVDGSAKETLELQKKELWKNSEKIKEEIIDLMYTERAARNKRYDSLANYLEPNIKYGPGGLRDLQQSLVTTQLYPRIFEHYKNEVSYLDNIKSFLLVVRYLQHIEGGGDNLVASLQQGLYKQLGFESRLKFTSQLQKSLSEINFYTQWIYELTVADTNELAMLYSLKVESFSDAMDVLLAKPNVLVQELVKNKIKPMVVRAVDKKEFASTFNKNNCNEKQVIALFSSGVIYKLFPHLERVKGLVQYDHYHRYTVDAHTLQALRYYFKSINSPEMILDLNSEWLAELDENSHSILIWSLIYHDMAKGLKGSHSELGAKLAITELSEFGFDAKFYQEVAWQVKNHLILSDAAFRKNPEAPSTWQWLSEKGLSPERLKILCVLTAIDIMATNIEAWTPWKSELLYRLVKQILSPKVSGFVELTKSLENIGTDKQREEYMKALEPMIVGSAPVEMFTEDFKALISKNKKSLPLRVHKIDEKYSWVRFHSCVDEKGLFLDWSMLLYTTGCAVREAYVNTLPSLGAYNWFKVKNRKSPEILLKQLKSARGQTSDFKEVQFKSVKLVDSPAENEWIVRFKGEDQEGALVGAVQKLFDNDLEIIWARVHTWGDVLEDIFAVKGEESNIKRLLI